MAKIKIVKWRGDNGQLAVSFPTQELNSSPTAIMRQRRPAAEEAARMLTVHWSRTIGRNIDQPTGLSFQYYREKVSGQQKSFHDRALRRYLKLFKAMGLK